MVLCPYRQPLVGRIQTRPFCDGPAQQDAIEFQPEVIVKTRGVVFLDQVREFFGCVLLPFRAEVRASSENRVCACILRVPFQSSAVVRPGK